nr:MAG: hypothetical protein [Microvirus sp.]
MSINAKLIRIHSDLLSTKGVLKYGRHVLCHTLELPWRSNDKNISCIPVGTYSIIKANSPRFGQCLYFRDVPARSGILVHVGNSVADTRGCILVGLDTNDKNVLHSRLAMDRILSVLPETFNLEVTQCLG